MNNKKKNGDIEVSLLPRVRGISKAWVRGVVSKSLECEKALRRGVSVLATDDRRIRALNKKFLRRDRVTDVIAFWSEPGFLAGEAEGYLGDLAVSAQRARVVAKELGIGFKEELGRYLVHGVLHLLGHTDKTPRKRTAMHRRQEEILRILR